MKLITTIILVFVICTIGCGQTRLPGYLVWDWDYEFFDAAGQPLDSAYTQFDTFYGTSTADTGYVFLDSTDTHTLRLLTYDVLYDNADLYFFVRARRTTNQAISLNSDTVFAYFPIILSGVPYEIDIIETKLP